MIYKKHILTKSDLTSHIHLTYIQLAKESIEYKVVIIKPKRRQYNNKQTAKNINELTKTNHFDR
jgi:hypothetical protein